MSTMTINPSGWTYVTNKAQSANNSGASYPKSNYAFYNCATNDTNWNKATTGTYGSSVAVIAATIVRFEKPISLKYAKINSVTLHWVQNGSDGSGNSKQYLNWFLAKYTTNNSMSQINWNNFKTEGTVGDWMGTIGQNSAIIGDMPETRNTSVTSLFSGDLSTSEITFVLAAGWNQTSPSFDSYIQIESCYLTVDYEAGTQPAPTPLYPKDVTLIEADSTLFSWQFNSETEAVQASAQLEYKATSAGSYTTVSLTQSGYSYTLNQRLAPGSYQWRVKVTNDAGTASGYSDIAYFNIVGRPAAPIINAPANKTLTEISWNTSNQQACEIILADQSGKELYHETLATGDTFYKPNFFLSGPYMFSVRVMNDSLMWSDWSQRAFTISAAGPTAATISLSQVGNSIKATFSLPADVEAVLMRSIGGAEEKILANVSFGTEYTDNTVASDVTYTYWIRTYVNGYTDSTKPTLSIHFEGSILTADDLTLNLTQSDEQFLPHSEDIYRDYALLNFSGREYPMIERGEFTTLEFARKYHVTDAQKAILDALGKKDGIFYRDNRKNAFRAALTRIHYEGFMNDGYLTTINLVRLNEEEVEVNV